MMHRLFFNLIILVSATTASVCQQTFMIIHNCDGTETEFSIDCIDSISYITYEDSMFNGQFVDVRDGEIYETVQIGEKTWIAQNMRFDTEDGIPNGYDNVFDQHPLHYGRFYNFYSAQAACPIGWHVPSQSEYQDFISDLGSTNVGYELKSTEDWLDNGNGSNSIGFNAFPAGIDLFGSLTNTGKTTTFWSSNNTIATGYGLSLDFDNNEAEVTASALELGFSVRCVKD